MNTFAATVDAEDIMVIFDIFAIIVFLPAAWFSFREVRNALKTGLITRLQDSEGGGGGLVGAVADKESSPVKFYVMLVFFFLLGIVSLIISYRSILVLFN